MYDRYNKEITKFLLACFSLILIGGQGVLSSQAATYYVAPNGNDANPGTLTHPFGTLNQATRTLEPGDTLYVRAGTYVESLINSIPGGLSWSMPVTVAAYPGETVTVKPGSGATRVVEINGEDRQYIIIDGLILDGANVGYDVFKIGGNGTVGVAHHIRLKNSEVRNSPGPGIVVDGTFYSGFSSNPGCCNEFIQLNVHDNGTTVNNQGLYIRSGGNIVEKSRIYRNKCCGINAFVSGGSRPDDNVIRNNEVFDNGLTNSKGDGILVGGYRAVVENNFVHGNNTVGIYVFGGDQRDAKIRNNTVVNNLGYGIWVDPASMNTTIANNIIYGNSTAPVQDDGSGTVSTDNLTSNPLFVDPATKNFKLQPSSPAIDKGRTIPEITKDFFGNPRPQGRAYDIGAYEHSGISDTQPPAAPVNVRVF
jgi:parallel beta-helix repeat protein